MKSMIMPNRTTIFSTPYNNTPLAAFRELSSFSLHAFLLDNSELGNDALHISMIGVDPAAMISIKDGIATISYRNGRATEKVAISNPIQAIEELMGTYCRQLDDVSRGHFEGLEHFPFVGGLVGYMGYGACHYLERISKQANDPLNVPDAYYGLYDSCLVFDHHRRKLTVISSRGEAYARSLLNQGLSASESAGPTFDGAPLIADEIFNDVEATYSREAYARTIEKAKDLIEAGQAFQIVFSQRYRYATTASPVDIYHILQQTNSSSYGYYLKFPDFVYLGSSPETFLRCNDRRLSLSAIAGTRPRGENSADDLMLEEELLHNEKEMAEHKMLVDLGRNDLGRVSAPGSVRIGGLANLSKYSHVMHLVTGVEGVLASPYSVFDAFRSCFPAGTVSGAPKIRAMQLLAGLEPEQRGIYAGAIGYFDFRGNTDHAIAIRSALIKDGIAHVNAGGGIVYDSNAELEYEESRHKARAVLQAIKLTEKLPI